jgi:hypothetical protein
MDASIKKFFWLRAQPLVYHLLDLFVRPERLASLRLFERFKHMKITGGEVQRVWWMWKTLEGQISDSCNRPGRGESATELTPFRNFLVHSYTCCSDKHASPYCTSILRWISMGLTASLPKKWMTECCSSLVHVESGATIFTLLLHHCVTFLHCTLQTTSNTVANLQENRAVFRFFVAL